MGLKANRRDFLKSGLLTTSLLGAGNVLGAESSGNAVQTASSKNGMISEIETDVLVVGAGSSGIPAAIAAAREGAKVLLIEDDPIPGGAPVDMYVAMPCGNPQVGIYKEILNHLNAEHNFCLHPDKKASWYMPFSWSLVLDQLIRKESNITLLCGVRVYKVLLNSRDAKTIEGVIIQRQNGVQQELKANVIIDATGTGEIADMADCESMFGREARSQFNELIGPNKADKKIQQCTWMFLTHKIRPDARLDLYLANTRWIANESGFGGVKKKNPKLLEEFIKRDAGVYLNWGGHIVCKDTRDPVEIARAQTNALKQVILRDAPQLMKYGYGMSLAPKLGVREVRRVVGEHILTVNDLINPEWPDDVVSIGKYGIDAWGDKTAKKVKIPRNGYGIPYRVLLAKGKSNLMVVGKAASSTHLAQSSLRVQPIVSQMGQAAGTAAAMAVAVKKDLRSINVGTLQDKLRNQGMLSPDI